jgi:hypothetical protein
MQVGPSAPGTMMHWAMRAALRSVMPALFADGAPMWPMISPPGGYGRRATGAKLASEFLQVSQYPVPRRWSSRNTFRVAKALAI